MKNFIALIMMLTFVWGAKVSEHIWEKGQTFSKYMEDHRIPSSLLGRISKDDQQFLVELQSSAVYYELTDEDGTLLQSLIPINDEMQIHLYKERKTGEYGFNIIPVVYEEDQYFAKIELKSNPYTDTIETIKLPRVAKRLGQALKGTIETRKLAKGDEIAFTYKQRVRLGKFYHMPSIEAIGVSKKEKTQFIYADEDGYGHLEGCEKSEYNAKGDFIHMIPLRDVSNKMGMPIRHVRITSHFSYRRWHPILHAYRPHQGTDFGAKKGTPLLSVYDGTVSYAGWMNGYGNVVKIKHPNGFESLYAHQSRLNARRGQRVKKGDIIGYAGSTGRSTGVHLHFGLTKSGKWVDPLKYLQQANMSKQKYEKIVIKEAKQYKQQLIKFEENNETSYIWEIPQAIGG